MTEDQAFALMRLQMLALGGNPQTGHMISDPYLYAWEESVFPLFDEGAPWHKPFAAEFNIPEDLVDELSKFLDRRWQDGRGTAPTFNEIEAHFDVRAGAGPWGRTKFIRACRYMFLHGMFDHSFWNQLLKEGEHPVEAASITYPMKRQEIHIG